MIKINVLGVKEGVGKSTVALSLARGLSSKGTTLLVDKTPSCGLWRKLGRQNDFWCEDKLCVLKLFKRPFRIGENDLKEALENLENAYRNGWDFVVIDNFSCATQENHLVKVDAHALTVFVTDVPNIRSTLDYSMNFPNKYALIVNMVPEGYRIPVELLGEFLFKITVPLIDTSDPSTFLKGIVEDITEISSKFS